MPPKPRDPARTKAVQAARRRLESRRRAAGLSGKPTYQNEKEEQDGYHFSGVPPYGRNVQFCWKVEGGRGKVNNLGAGKRSPQEVEHRQQQLQANKERSYALSVAMGLSPSTYWNTLRDGSRGGSGRKRGLKPSEQKARASEQLKALATNDMTDDERAEQLVHMMSEHGELPALNTLLANADTRPEQLAIDNLLMLIEVVMQQRQTAAVDLEDGGGPRTGPRRGIWDFGLGVGRLGVEGELLTAIVDETDIAGLVDGKLQECWDEVDEISTQTSAILHQFGREAAVGRAYGVTAVLTDVGRALWAAFNRNANGATRSATPVEGLSMGMDVLAWLFGITFEHRAFSDCQNQHRIWGAILRALARHYVRTGQVCEESGVLLGMPNTPSRSTPDLNLKARITSSGGRKRTMLTLEAIVDEQDGGSFLAEMTDIEFAKYQRLISQTEILQPKYMQTLLE